MTENLNEYNYKVSIIVPIYNVENYIERCAISLFEQSYNNLEYIFVNDCTPDQSINILNQVICRYKSLWSRCLIINHNINRGVAAARNSGLNSCTGLFVCQVDPDDYLERNAIKSLVEKQLITNADIVTGKMTVHQSGKTFTLSFPDYKSKEEMVVDMMQTTFHHSLCNRMIRRSLYEDHQIRAVDGINCGEDCWIMTQLAYYADSFAAIDGVVYHYDCTRDGSYMRNKDCLINKKKHHDDIATAHLIVDFFKDKEKIFYDEAHRVLIRYLNNVLSQAALYKDKAYFDTILEEIEDIDSSYWNTIGWDKTYRRTIFMNMHSANAFYHLQKLYSKLLAIRL